MSLLLAASNNGKELWYLTRGSGVVALLLLTASVLLGVANTTRWKTDRWPRFIVYGLHRNLTLLALAFTVVHVVTTIADSFAPIGLVDTFIPFLSPYRPFWLGLGTVAFDLLLALIVTSLLRRRIGNRTWRAVHWLAYASWPVAALHSLGTGSDARAGWLHVLGVASCVVVLGAVLWRVLVAREAEPLLRAAATLGTVGALVGLLVWASNGPLQSGWAARAGTPTRLLRTVASGRAEVVSARTRRHPAVSTPVPTLPHGAFTARLNGQITESQTDRGLVVVAIDGSTHGGFHGRVHVALRGFPLDGGGVQMQDSVVGLLPLHAPQWSSGTVTGLAGTQIVSEIHSPDGRAYRVELDLSIGGGNTVTGLVKGRSL